jgi:hypothetical protein
MPVMMKLRQLLLAVSLLVPGLPAARAESVQAEMKSVEFLVGEWTGEGWVISGPGGRKTFTIHESVQRKIDGRVLLLEGLGKSPGPEGKERISHQALSMLAYDPEAHVYRLSAYREGSGFIAAEATASDHALVWTFKDARAGDIRFSIRLDDKGQWSEVGEASSDGGKRWHQFLAMTLHRG